jgi:hypothetical protein
MTEPAARPRFQQLQFALTAHIRDPQRVPGPAAIEDRRLQIYRELFYNNVEGCLASAFPVLRKLSSDERWHARVRAFFAGHVCHAPQFHRVPEEFLQFLGAAYELQPGDPPFLRDLAHYEWVELELSISPLELMPELADPDGDFLERPPLLSPLAWTLAYDFPVQRIGPDFQPRVPDSQPTYLIVNRDRQDRVRFLEINAVTARLMESMEADPAASGRALLLRIAAELRHPQPEQIVAQGVAIFGQLRERDIVLGTQRA